MLFWLNAYFFLMFQIVDLILALFPPQLVPCRFFFISLSVTFVSPWVFYVVVVLSEFLEHPDHQCFELCIWWVGYLFCLVFFLGVCSVLSFGPCFLVSSIGQPSCVCVCVLAGAASTPCPSSVVHLDECGFFKSLVVRLPHSSVFWWFCVSLALRSGRNSFCGWARSYPRLHLDQKFWTLTSDEQPGVTATHPVGPTAPKSGSTPFAGDATSFCGPSDCKATHTQAALLWLDFSGHCWSVSYPVRCRESAFWRIPG